MSEEATFEMITTDQVRELLRRRFPPQDANDPQTVYNSLIIALCERMDGLSAVIAEQTQMLERQRRALHVLTKMVASNSGTESPAVEEPQVSSDQSSAEKTSENPMKDRTPFPTGFSPAPPPKASASPKSPGVTVSKDENGEVVVQNTSTVTTAQPGPPVPPPIPSGRVVQVSPIPSGVVIQQPNGSKT